MAEIPTTNAAAEQNAFLCTIGHICLQWALLEQTILFIIGAIENVPIQKAFVMFAGLDMLPRLTMAINLAQEAKLPHLRFIKPLQDIRKEIREGLSDRRNLFVHGSHQLTEQQGEYVLVMSRWKGDKQRQTVSLLDGAKLSQDIAVLAQKANAIFCDYGLWKFGTKQDGNADQKIAQIKTSLRFIRAQQIKRAVKLILTNLKPW